MLPKRQRRIPARPDGDVWVRSFAVRFTAGYRATAHDHTWHQLSYGSAGVLRVATAESAWIVPPHRAVWIPAGTAHGEEIRGSGTIRNLYFASAICRGLTRHCAVINVPPLLRELIVHTAESGVLSAKVPAQRHLARVLVDQLAALSPTETERLPMPRDPRALQVAQRLRDEPANAELLESLARRAGTSKRTLQRLFENETRLTFARWRQRLRVHAAIEHLAAGRSVTDTALDVGYASVSAFVSSFRREFGVSPGRSRAVTPR